MTDAAVHADASLPEIATLRTTPYTATAVGYEPPTGHGTRDESDGLAPRWTGAALLVMLLLAAAGVLLAVRRHRRQHFRAPTLADLPPPVEVPAEGAASLPPPRAAGQCVNPACVFLATHSQPRLEAVESWWLFTRWIREEPLVIGTNPDDALTLCKDHFADAKQALRCFVATEYVTRHNNLTALQKRITERNRLTARGAS